MPVCVAAQELCREDEDDGPPSEDSEQEEEEEGPTPGKLPEGRFKRQRRE